MLQKAASALGLVALLACVACRGDERETRRVLVFGVDGGSWNVMRPLIRAGELPALGGLYERSIRGVLRAEIPLQSPVLWSSIFTGRPPAEHGVEGWETALGSNRRVKTIWTIAEESGLTSRVVNVPSTWPPETVNGTTVAGMPVPQSTPINGTGAILTLSDGSYSHDVHPLARVHTARLLEIAGALETDEWSAWIDLPHPQQPAAGGRAQMMKLDADRAWLSPVYRYGPGVRISAPREFVPELEEAVGRPYVPEGPGFLLWDKPDTVRYTYPHLHEITRMHLEAARALAETRWELFVFVSTFVDRISHLYWPHMFPEDYEGLEQADVELYRDLVTEAYREADRQLGELLAIAGEDTWVVVLSDHGFSSSGDPPFRKGTHTVDGIYMVAGPGIEAADGPRQRNLDAGPTILHLLGIPPAEDMTGRVFSLVASQIGAPADGPASYERGRARRAETSAEDEREALEQIRSLGYLEADPSTTPEPSEEPRTPPDDAPDGV